MPPASSDPTSLAILAKAQQRINEVMVRCHEATSYLSHREYLPAIGALAGLEDLVRYVSTLLIVLRDTEKARTRLAPTRGSRRKEALPLDKPEKLHLVIVYSASESTYALSMHNEPRDKVEQYVADYNPHMKPGFTLITLEQQEVHQTKEAQDCKACRETVRRSSGLVPLPKFTRRMV